MGDVDYTVPRFDFGPKISGLTKSYYEGLDQAYKRRNQDAFQDGVPKGADGQPDLPAIASTIMQQGGTGPSLEAGKLVQQQGLLRGLQSMGTNVFGGGGQQPPNAPTPPQNKTGAPPAGAWGGGDNGSSTLMSVVAPIFGDENAGRMADVIGSRLKITDANRPLSPDQLIAAQKLTQDAAKARGIQLPARQAEPPATQGNPGMASVNNDPTLGGLIPPNHTIDSFLPLLRRAATMAASTGIRNAEKPYIDAIDSIQKRLQPTEEFKNYLAGKKDGESFPQWIDRKDKNAQELSVLQHSIIPRLEKSQETANSARTDLDAITAARAEVNADKGIFSGKLAEQKLQLAKFGTLFGFPDEQVANTEAFKAAIGSRVMGLVKGLGSGTSISNSDRVFAEKMSGGQIQLNDTSIRRILDIGQRAANVHLQRHDVLVSRAVDANPALKQFEKVYRVEGGQAAAPQSESGGNLPVDGATATNPKTGERLIYRNGNWLPHK